MRCLYLYIVTLFTVAASGLPLSAVTVTSQAGRLSEVVSDTGISQLTITGTLDATDFDFISSRLAGLRSLDLSSAVIEACSGVNLANGRTASPANMLPEYSLAGSPITSITLPSSLTSIADGALAGTSIMSLVIPEQVDSLGRAFCNGCVSLQTVSFATTRLDAIPDGAFKNCTSLIDIELPQAVVTIGADAFSGCTSLEHISLPANLVTIAARAFNGCSQLETITPDAKLGYIGDNAFSYTALSDIDLSGCRQLKTIGGWALAGCNQLTEVTLPDCVTTFGDGIFFDCDALATVVLPATATTLTPYMFKGTSLTDNDVIGSRTSVIGPYALYGNSRITMLTLPSTLTAIGDKAMAGMSGLTRIDATALADVPVLGRDVFEGTAGSDVTLAVDESMADVFRSTPQWQEFNVTSGVAARPDVNTDGSLNVSMKYDHNTLYINSTEPMALIAVIDITGHVLARHTAGDATLTSISLNTTPGTPVVVSIMFTNSLRATYKTIL